jgi:hypothetical protein
MVERRSKYSNDKMGDGERWRGYGGELKGIVNLGSWLGNGQLGWYLAGSSVCLLDEQSLHCAGFLMTARLRGKLAKVAPAHGQLLK